MAEAILKSMQIPGVEVRSAGVFAIDGSDASINTRKVLEEKEISHSHRSSMLTPELVEWATYILTMTSGHKQTVISMYPEWGGTFTLKEFAGASENLDINDPFGGSIEITGKHMKKYTRILKK